MGRRCTVSSTITMAVTMTQMVVLAQLHLAVWMYEPIKAVFVSLTRSISGYVTYGTGIQDGSDYPQYNGARHPVC